MCARGPQATSDAQRTTGRWWGPHMTSVCAQWPEEHQEPASFSRGGLDCPARAPDEGR